MKKPLLMTALALLALNIPYALGETTPKTDKKAATTASADTDMDTMQMMMEQMTKPQSQPIPAK